MGFKINLSDAEQGGLKPAGDYECIITAIEERTTRNGATGLNFTFVIRNDVAGQKYGNACLFHTLWKRKEPSELDMQVNGYGFGQVMAMGKAAVLPDGKDYENLAAFCKDLLQKCVRVTIKHDEYNGKEREVVNYVNPTKYPDCHHKFKQAAPKADTFAQPQQSMSIGNMADFEEVLSDDNVPF